MTHAHAHPDSVPLAALDCPERMFLVSLCLDDRDVRELGFAGYAPTPAVSEATAGRTALHRACREIPELAARVADLLDLRHLDTVLAVRGRAAGELGEEASRHGCLSCGSRLAGWAWALLTDSRREVAFLGRRLMGECYVRGMGRIGAGAQAAKERA